jgi:hypothetical protein
MQIIDEIGTDIKLHSNRHLQKNEYHSAKDHIIRYKVHAILYASYNTVVRLLRLEGTITVAYLSVFFYVPTLQIFMPIFLKATHSIH